MPPPLSVIARGSYQPRPALSCPERPDQNVNNNKPNKRDGRRPPHSDDRKTDRGHDEINSTEIATVPYPPRADCCPGPVARWRFWKPCGARVVRENSCNRSRRPNEPRCCPFPRPWARDARTPRHRTPALVRGRNDEQEGFVRAALRRNRRRRHAPPLLLLEALQGECAPSQVCAGFIHRLSWSISFSLPQVILVSAVVLFVLINTIVTLLPAGRRDPRASTAAANGGPGYNGSTSKWPAYGDATKYISIEVLSSRDRVRICVDDATVMIILPCSSVALRKVFVCH